MRLIGLLMPRSQIPYLLAAIIRAIFLIQEKKLQLFLIKRQRVIMIYGGDGKMMNL
jgi:hypothetical protein